MYQCCLAQADFVHQFSSMSVVSFLLDANATFLKNYSSPYNL